MIGILPMEYHRHVEKKAIIFKNTINSDQKTEQKKDFFIINGIAKSIGNITQKRTSFHVSVLLTKGVCT